MTSIFNALFCNSLNIVYNCSFIYGLSFLYIYKSVNNYVNIADFDYSNDRDWIISWESYLNYCD